MPHALAALAAGDLLNRAAAHHRTRLLVQNILVARAARVFVLGLDEQPIVMTLVAGIVRPSAHAHQVPVAVQLLAVKLEVQMSLGVTLVRVVVWRPRPAIPDCDRAAAVFAGRDGAFERVVFDRMVFDMDRKPLLAGVETGAARHCPAFHHPVQFKPQVVVQSTGSMLLNHVKVAATSSLAAPRLWRDAELAFFAVGFERHDASTGPIRALCDR